MAVDNHDPKTEQLERKVAILTELAENQKIESTVTKVN